MTSARIFKPAKPATQSGMAKSKNWILKFDSQGPKEIEPLMGWTSSRDTLQQVTLTFETKEDAIAYAKRNGIAYRVEEPKEPARRITSYSDNFKFNRSQAWTH